MSVLMLWSMTIPLVNQLDWISSSNIRGVDRAADSSYIAFVVEALADTQNGQIAKLNYDY